jgi:predicted DsbA family dithiol-disulfide isomerase
MARELNAPLDLSRIAVTPNTLGAHQLIRLAHSLGRQDKVVDAVMTAYFAEGRDIGDPDTLCDIGEVYGLSRINILETLADSSGANAVAAEYATAAEAGITGVPFAIFNGRMSVAGAQSPERYALGLRKAASKAMAGGD